MGGLGVQGLGFGVLGFRVYKGDPSTCEQVISNL